MQLVEIALYNTWLVSVSLAVLFFMAASSQLSITPAGPVQLCVSSKARSPPHHAEFTAPVDIVV